MAKVHFYEVAVRDYESYTPLLLHLHIVKIFYSYFRLGLVEKVAERQYSNALNNQYCKNLNAYFIQHRFTRTRHRCHPKICQ